MKAIHKPTLQDRKNDYWRYKKLVLKMRLAKLPKGRRPKLDMLRIAQVIRSVNCE